MAYATKFWQRHSIASLSEGDKGDPQGNLFFSPLGQWNADTLQVLHHGVDTIRQLYSGLLRPDVYASIKALFDVGHGQMIDFAGNRWLVGSGKRGGYRYMLQNADYGVVVLLGSSYVEEGLNGSQLKIQLSPHFILERSVDDVQACLNTLADLFMTQAQPCGVAVHLACDMHGLDVPLDLDSRLTTKARASRRSGASYLEFEGFGDVVQIFGRGQSFLFGGPTGLQFAVYRKDVQAEETDKLHFWRAKWETATSEHTFPETCYSSKLAVWRVEARFHHTVVQEFAYGSGLELNSFKQVSEHLTGLWRYALNNFRLDQTSTYVRPEWQFLMESVQFVHNPPHLLYKRAKKKPGELNGRSLAIAFGGLTSVYARNRYDLAYAYKCLQASGIYRDLVNHYGFKELGPGFSESDGSAVVYDLFRLKLEQKILRGAAV